MASQAASLVTPIQLRERSGVSSLHNYSSKQDWALLRSGSVLKPIEDVPTSHDVISRFGRRLRQLRKERNLTQTAMARTFGLDRSYISDVERGRKSISLPTLEVVALGLHVSLQELLKEV